MKLKRILAFCLTLALVAGLLPSVGLFASAAEDAPCAHHTVHTPDCGYAPAVEGQPCTHECGEDCSRETLNCTHVHDGACGYAPAVAEVPEVPCGHVHDENCGENGETCAHEHDETCGYTAAVPAAAEVPCTHAHTEDCYVTEPACTHTHDAACGYIEATEGTPCNFTCPDCAAEAQEEQQEEPGEEAGEETGEETGEEPEEEPPVCNCEAVDGVHAETCPLYTAPEAPEGPEVGDKIWIKPGSVVYKSTEDGEGYTLTWKNYNIEITETILNEEGTAAWYRFNFASIGLGELILRDYHYVRVENTSAEEPDDTQQPEPPELPESPEQLAQCEDLATMVKAMTEECVDTAVFTESDVLLVESRMVELIRSVDDPTGEEIDDYYFMLNQMLDVRETLGMCTCASSTDSHCYYCPLYSTSGSVRRAVRTRSAAPMAAADTDGEDGVFTNKWVEKIEDSEEERFRLSIEAYATGTTTTTQYIKPADMVIVVDQSASMLYADKPDLNGGIPVSGTKGHTRGDLEYNTNAQKLASHGLYYMAVGYATMCFLVYKDDGWYYFDTHLSKSGGVHPYWPSSWGTTPSGYWDGCMEEACKSWDHINGNLQPMNNDLWTTFQTYGIYPTRYGSIYWALDAFLDEVASNEADHRISIVGFAGRDEGETEILCGLQNVKTTDGFNAVQAAIDNILCTGYYMHHDAGIEEANKVFAANYVDLDTRDRNLIFFSDGEGSGGTNHDKTLWQSYTAKKNHGAKVYSIATAAAPKDLMNPLSSNYPDAKSQNDWGIKASDDYFFYVENSSDLVNIFGQLSSTVGSTTTTLTESSYIKDVVTQYFTIPEDTDAVQAYTVKCTGYENGVPQWDTGKEFVAPEDIKREGNTVYVTGFDYAGNFVSEGGRLEGTTDQSGNFHGRKLVIEIIIEPKDDFVGGNQVVTNAPGSGLYDQDNKPLEDLPVPDVDVSLPEIELNVPDLHSYLGSDFLKLLTLNKITKPVTLWRDDHPIALDLTKDDLGLEDWQIDYSDVQLVIVDEQGNELTDGIADIRKDTKYSIRIKITPEKDGSIKQEAESHQADIHVFYPELTFEDQTYWYGETVPDSDALMAAKTELKWRNREGHYSTGPNFSTGRAVMSGEAPDVTFTSTPKAEGTLPKTDVPVDVTVNSIGYVTGDLSSYTYFKWQACMPECGQHIDEHTGTADSPEFYLHMNNCRLTVVKAGGTNGEPYLFNIMKDGKKYTEISITGNGSATIYELPVGTYSIGEDMDWSWRFKEAPEISAPVDLNRNNEDGTITCTNTLEDEKWFNHYSAVVPNTYGIAIN